MSNMLIDVFEQMSSISQSLRDLCSGDFIDGDREILADRARNIERAVGWVLGKGFGAGEIEEEIAVAAKFVPDPTIIIDAGANAGGWSRRALARWSGAKVYAYEPQTANNAHFDFLKQSYPERFEYSNVAVSNLAGNAILYGNLDGDVLTSLYDRNISHYDLKFRPLGEVKTVTLDEEIKRRGLTHIDILKLDVEGHELAVLQGLGKAIARTRYVQLEFGGTCIDARTFVKDFFVLFEAHGFKFYRIAPVGPILISHYDESVEDFRICNYVAVNGSLYDGKVGEN